VIVYATLWLVFSPATFEWNAVATLAVFVMTLFIQRANRRDNLALHAKLDELLRVDDDARSELTQLDEQEPEVIERLATKKCARAAADFGSMPLPWPPAIVFLCADGLATPGPLR
jgi:low affinity Fe/Cu permease